MYYIDNFYFLLPNQFIKLYLNYLYNSRRIELSRQRTLDYTEIGSQIRKFRKLKNMSQEQLAEKIDISITHMSHIETGTTKLSLPVLVKLAEVLDVPSDAILFEDRKVYSQDKLPDILKSCTPAEFEIISELVKTAKKSLGNFSITEK